MIKDKIRAALIRAIKRFISFDEVFTEDFLEESANDWVYNHDEYIKDLLANSIDLNDNFDDALDDIHFYDIF